MIDKGLRMLGMILISSLNTVLAILAGIVMASIFFKELIQEANRDKPEIVEGFFIQTVLQPATGMVFVTVVCALVVYQKKIASVGLALSAHALCIISSSLVLLKTFLLMGFY